MKYPTLTLFLLGLGGLALLQPAGAESPWTPVDDGVPRAATTVGKVRVGGDLRWRYGLLGAHLRYPRDQFSKQRTRLWLEAELEPTTVVRVGFRDDPLTDLQVDEAFARRQVRSATVTVGRQYVLLGPLGLLFNTSLEALSALRVEGEARGWKWLGVAGVLEGNDGFLALRAERPFPGGRAGLNLLRTGYHDDRGQSLDVSWEGPQGRWNAEVSQVDQTGPRKKSGWAWLVGYERDVDPQLMVGGSLGQVDGTYRPFYSSLTHPYLADGVSAFDRPLFLDPDNVASGVEIRARYRLPQDSLAQLRWYQGRGRVRGGGHGAVALGYTRRWDERTSTSVVVGYQSLGPLPDLWMIRGEAAWNF